MRQDVLFYVRQKHQDLLTQLAVSIQNYLAIDIVIKNNVELIKGVDRATTTTISALRTAVIVAQALNNQKLVLDQITALNTTTSGLIQRTSRDAARQLGAHPGAGGVRRPSDCPSCRPRSRTSTRPWTPSTRSRCRPWTPWRPPIGTLETEVAQVAGVPRAGQAAGPAARDRHPRPRNRAVRARRALLQGSVRHPGRPAARGIDPRGHAATGADQGRAAGQHRRDRGRHRRQGRPGPGAGAGRLPRAPDLRDGSRRGAAAGQARRGQPRRALGHGHGDRATCPRPSTATCACRAPTPTAAPSTAARRP